MTKAKAKAKASGGLYVGIDPGTKCGWAVLDARGERVASGTWDLSGGRHEGGGMRYLRARRLLRELLADKRIAALAYEEVRRHAGTDAAHVYGGIVAQVSAECEDVGVAYSAVPVGTVKKQATGNGSASKEAMLAAARSRWGEDVVGEDEADALWIADSLRTSLAG